MAAIPTYEEIVKERVKEFLGGFKMSWNPLKDEYKEKVEYDDYRDEYAFEPLYKEFNKQCKELEDKMNAVKDSYWEFSIDVDVEDDTITLSVVYENTSKMNPLDFVSIK